MALDPLVDRLRVRRPFTPISLESGKDFAGGNSFAANVRIDESVALSHGLERLDNH
jgi:hypothetical protein